MTTLQDETQAASNVIALLPPGYVKTVPFSTDTDITFEFNGVSVQMSALYLNEYLNCYMFDLSWSATDMIYGIPIKCGLDILEQYTTPLPNLYANNSSYPGADVDSWRDLSLFIIDVSVLEIGQ